jgi:hypothetical protein
MKDPIDGLTVTKLNLLLQEIATEEYRTVTPIERAWYKNDIVYTTGSNFTRFERVRRKLAEAIDMIDVYDGNPGFRDKAGMLYGHFVPDECREIPS